MPAVVTFFGMQWDKQLDRIGPYPIALNLHADTKRKILSSLNSVFDLFNIYGPILNRAKLFLHGLKINDTIGWDSKLPPETTAEWPRICKQANSTPSIMLERFVGKRESDYTLVGFSNASSEIYGAVIYLIDNNTKSCSFIMAKSRVIGPQMRNKSIPSLECQRLTFAAELLREIFEELCSDKVVTPITIAKVVIYTDSLFSLSWVKNYFTKHEKMQKRSVFVMNRLKQIGEITKDLPMTFRFIKGRENPADAISRATSYKTLMKTNYFSGPEFLKDLPAQSVLEITIPLKNYGNEGTVDTLLLVSGVSENHKKLALELNSRSSFIKEVRIYKQVLTFIHKLKEMVALKNGKQKKTTNNQYKEASELLNKTDQELCFPDIYNFLNGRILKAKIPNLVLQLNIYSDDNGLLRVKSKFKASHHPILLAKESALGIDINLSHTSN